MPNEEENEHSTGSSSSAVDDSMQQWCLAQGLSRTLMAPFDRVKFLIQCQGELHRLGRLDRPFRSSLSCVQQLVTYEGVPSLFRGNWINLVQIVPAVFAQAFVATPVQRLVFDALPHYTSGTFFLASMVSGVVGGGASCLLTYPFDFLRFRMLVDVKTSFHTSYEFRHSLDILRNPTVIERPHSMYRGLGLYLAGSFLYRWMFQTTLQLISPWMPTDEEAAERLRAYATLTAVGYGATSAVTLALYPLDTVRRRMMLAVLHEEGQYHNVGHCCRTILRTEGAAGFYRGMGVMLVRNLVAVTMTSVGLFA